MWRSDTAAASRPLDDVALAGAEQSRYRASQSLCTPVCTPVVSELVAHFEGGHF
jgi:hypothetical protein